MITRLLPVLLACVLLPGCLFQNLSPTTQLSERVYALNEEARWGRMDLAAQRVMPRYRQRFLDSRRAWGREIAIADVEVSALVLAEDSESATSAVEINWYDQRTMVLRSTLLRQRWAKTDAGFFLEEEDVTGGDEELLEPGEEAEASAPSTRG
jgi:hypothetical protein